jgi:hypothetical protein
MNRVELTHLALAPSAVGTDAAAAVLELLAGLEPPDRQALTCLPAPHRPRAAAGKPATRQ